MRVTFRETREVIVDDDCAVTLPAPSRKARGIRAVVDWIEWIVCAFCRYVLFEAVLLCIALVGLIGRGIDRGTRFAWRNSTSGGLCDLMRARSPRTQPIAATMPDDETPYLLPPPNPQHHVATVLDRRRYETP